MGGASNSFVVALIVPGLFIKEMPDEHLRSSSRVPPDLLAIGDCCRVDNHLLDGRKTLPRNREEDGQEMVSALRGPSLVGYRPRHTLLGYCLGGPLRVRG